MPAPQCACFCVYIWLHVFTCAPVCVHACLFICFLIRELCTPKGVPANQLRKRKTRSEAGWVLELGERRERKQGKEWQRGLIVEKWHWSAERVALNIGPDMWALQITNITYKHTQDADSIWLGHLINRLLHWINNNIYSLLGFYLCSVFFSFAHRIKWIKGKPIVGNPWW